MNPGQTPEERQRAIAEHLERHSTHRAPVIKPAPAPPPFVRDERTILISLSTIETALTMIDQHGCCWGPDVADAENELEAALAAMENL